MGQAHGGQCSQLRGVRIVLAASGAYAGGACARPRRIDCTAPQHWPRPIPINPRIKTRHHAAAWRSANCAPGGSRGRGSRSSHPGPHRLWQCAQRGTREQHSPQPRRPGRKQVRGDRAMGSRGRSRCSLASASARPRRSSALSVKAILEKSTVDYVDTSRTNTSSVLGEVRERSTTGEGPPIGPGSRLARGEGATGPGSGSGAAPGGPSGAAARSGRERVAGAAAAVAPWDLARRTRRRAHPRPQASRMTTTAPSCRQCAPAAAAAPPGGRARGAPASRASPWLRDHSQLQPASP